MKRSMSGLARLLTGRWSAWGVVAVVVAGSFLLLGVGGTARVTSDPTAGLPSSAQSTTVARLQTQLPSGQVTPAVVVYSRPGGQLSDADLTAAAAQVPALRRFAVRGTVPAPVPAPDRTAAVVTVPLPVSAGDDRNAAVVKDIRAVVRSGLPPGAVAQVTGGAAFSADLSGAFDGANATLLLATAGVVALLLLVTYRSPLLWLVPLAAVGLADQVAAAVLAIVSRHTSMTFDAAATGIVEVLVFGAGTDYALLLIARYREELREHPDRRQAMRRALRAAGPAVAASGTTVVLALLTLLAASFGGNRALGVGGAIGIAVALAFALVLLPAALVVWPRGIFWPLVPRADEAGRRATAREGRAWRRIGEATARRPWRVVAGTLVLLAALGAGVASTSLGLSQADTFRTKAESVDGLATLSRAFPAGAVDPVVVVTEPGQVTAVVAAARKVPRVADVRPGEATARLAEVDVVLTPAPDTPASYATIRGLRAAVVGIPGTAVGGSVATNLDTRTAARHDLRLIAPVILLVVFAVLVVLLRALVAPVVLMATVVLSFFAALGGASLLFTYVLHYPGLDEQVPLLSFLFLVALGVDYNIFLVTRAREEAGAVGTRVGIVDALAVTGGVITSAGILLAAVFTVLGVLPVTVLTELGVIVGLGVLLDTLLVRTVLVPAFVQVLGERFWLPGRVPRRPAPAGALPRVPAHT